MPAPAVIISTETSPPPRSSPTDTGPVFLPGIAERGPAATASVPSLVEQGDEFLSLAQWSAVYGGRIAGSRDYDWIESYFRTGGSKVFYSRTLGDSPVKASLNLAGSSGTTLVVTAPFYGSKYSAYKVQVVAGDSGGSYRVVKLLDASSVVLDVTAEFNTQAGFLGLTLADPAYDGDFVISAGGGTVSVPIVAAAAALTSTTGADDAAAADESNVELALDQFQPDLGPGQVATPNWAGDADVHATATAHAAEMATAGSERHAVLDSSSATLSKAALEAEGAALQGDVNSSYGQFVGTWITVRPLTANGQDRSVPGSALVCGRLSDTDARFSPNRAAAGTKDGVGVATSFVTGVGSVFARTPQGTSDADDLSDAGVNLIVVKNGQVVVYDDITLVDPDGEEQNYLHVPNARYRMWLVALLREIGEGEQFDQINATTIAEFNIRVTGVLKQHYGAGILVPDPDDPREATAYAVDTDTPNTSATMQAGELNVNVAVRPARSARIINITITAVSLTDSVA